MPLNIWRGKVICSARTVKEGTHPLEGSLEKTIGDIQAAGGEARSVAFCEELGLDYVSCSPYRVPLARLAAAQAALAGSGVAQYVAAGG